MIDYKYNVFYDITDEHVFEISNLSREFVKSEQHIKDQKHYSKYQNGFNGKYDYNVYNNHLVI